MNATRIVRNLLLLIILSIILTACGGKKDKTSTTQSASLLPFNAEWTVSDVKRLIDRGANVNARDESTHWTVLMEAVKYARDPRIIQALIEAGAEVDGYDWENSETPLMIAVRSNKDIAIVRTLLDAGANVDERSSLGTTPLTLAITDNDNEDVLRLLANASQRINEPSDRGILKNITPLELAITSRESPSVVETLINAGADVNRTQFWTERTMLMVAAHCMVDPDAHSCRTSSRQMGRLPPVTQGQLGHPGRVKASPDAIETHPQGEAVLERHRHTDGNGNEVSPEGGSHHRVEVSGHIPLADRKYGHGVPQLSFVAEAQL